MRLPVGYLSQQQHPISTTTTAAVSNRDVNSRRIRSRSQFFGDMSAGAVTPTRNGGDKEAPIIGTTTTTPRPNSTSPAPASASSSSSTTQPELPSFLHDPVLSRTYARGRFLGKGGFAWCYEVTDVRNHEPFALKVVPKTRVVKQRHRDKVLREISIHHPLRHRHIVRLYSAFEDDNNIYMVLELCQLDSLVSVMKKRKLLSDADARYYLIQLLMGVQYLHEEARVLHRDLKLGNMLLTDKMQIKIADFGLAAEMGRNGCGRVGQVCGTPNYISPEVLRKEGHSSASEAWAIGCIMYAMLIGKPPFETNSLDTTYAMILACRYDYPPYIRVSSSARDLIRLFLHPDPRRRPTPPQALAHEFFSPTIPIAMPPPEPYFAIPNIAQVTFLTGASQGKMSQATSSQRIRSDALLSQVVIRAATTTTAAAYHRSSTPFEIMDDQNHLGGLMVKAVSKTTTSAVRGMAPVASYQPSQGTQNVSPCFTAPSAPAVSMYSSGTSSTPVISAASPYSVCALDKSGNVSFGPTRENALTQWLYDMFHTLNETLYYRQGSCQGAPSTNATDLSKHVLYVSKWIDYSNRHGFGCQFNNGGVSVMQNDRTRLCLSTDRRYCRRWHFDRDSGGCVNGSDLLDMGNPPADAQDSLDVLRHFVEYMDVNLMTGGFSDAVAPSTLAVPFIVLWRRFAEHLLIILSDGTFQVNFIGHHTKVVLTRLPSSSSKREMALTFIDESRMARTTSLTNAIGSIIDIAQFQRVRDLLGDYILTPNDCLTAEI